MTYIYIATRIITFFGAYLRAFFQHVACRIGSIPVEDVRIFKANEMCGHVEHALAENLKQSVLITFIPFTMNFILGCCMLLTGSYRIFFAGQIDAVQPFILTWLGFSCLCNCAPLYEDVLALKSYLYSSKNVFIKIILSPMYVVYFVNAFAERFSVTVLLSAVFTCFFPQLFNVFFPAIDKLYQMFGNVSDTVGAALG